MELLRLNAEHSAAAIDLLARAGLSGAAALPFYLANPDAYPFAAWQDGQMVGTGLAFRMADGRSGWVANIAVDPIARGQGLGSLLTRHAALHLQSQGTPRVMLIATPMGQPIYERMGFRVCGQYTAWTGQPQPGRPEDLGFTALTAADEAAMATLDHAATGEDRSRVLAALRSAHGGWGRHEGGELVAFHIACPWGGGPAIAQRPELAVHLVSLLRSLAQEPTVTIRTPSANREVAQHLEAAGFTVYRQPNRMVLGDAPPAWQPDRIVSCISFGLG